MIYNKLLFMWKLMSSKKLDTALLEVRGWTVDDVANVLQQNGLGDFEESFKKRNIDGDALLSLTEGMLVLWKRELGLPNIRKIGNFIEDVRREPDKYCVPIRSKPTARRTSHRISSWNTVFDSVIEYQNLDPNFDPHSRHSLDETISETLYENQIEEKSPANGDIQPDIPSVPAKPPIPARPPSMRPRPKVIHASTLPVPPIPDDNEHLKTFISYIKLPSLEEKDSYHTSESELYEIPNPDDISESTAESWEPSKNHWSPSIEPYEEKYCSAEYESIKETNGVEYYLHPSAVDTSPKPPLETTKHQLRELPEAPTPPVKPKGLTSNASVILPPSTVPPPRPLESKPVQVDDSEGDSFDAKSGRVEYVLKKVISGPPVVPGALPKKGSRWLNSVENIFPLIYSIIFFAASEKKRANTDAFRSIYTMLEYFLRSIDN
ncbi:hypothetical protein J437_LFUL010430 [Ladona fulva]|uniref:SAM domain-containing protein n=1 Tax=Ladona fulva TaxID=123851 RepID=A0A8K0JTV1_LADFU|nr:hypothetical protein J437_LFUL010430 [Ladona fulva]